MAERARRRYRPPGGLPRRPPRDEGSALLLAPAGLLILLVLATLCFDLTLAFQRKRELVELADAAANDAVTFGIDEGRLRRDGAYCLDERRVARSVAASVAVSGPDAVVTGIDLVPGPDGTCAVGVAVRLRTSSPSVFGRAVPATPDALALEAVGRATAVVR